MPVSLGAALCLSRKMLGLRQMLNKYLRNECLNNIDSLLCPFAYSYMIRKAFLQARHYILCEDKTVNKINERFCNAIFI